MFPKQKRIVNKKLLESYHDSHCAVCGTSYNVSGHHLKSVGSGGDDVPDNLIPLCLNHHEEVHRIGLMTFSKRYTGIEAILISKNWKIDSFYNKWMRLDRDGWDTEEL